MTAIVTPADVRTYLKVTGTTGQWDDTLLTGYISAALRFLEVQSGHTIEAASATTITVSTRGRRVIDIPDVRSISEVRLSDAVLTVTDDYVVRYDRHSSSVATAIRLRSNPNRGFSAYNDLAIDGTPGWSPAHPDQLLANKVLAAWYAKRPDALMTGGLDVGEGIVVDISKMPPEVTTFLRNWERVVN